MTSFDKSLNSQVSNGVALYVDGYPVSAGEIASARLCLLCCRGSGSSCTPPPPAHEQSDGYTTPGMPKEIVRRIRALRHGCTSKKKASWMGEPCGPTHAILPGDSRQYLSSNDSACTALRPFCWDYKKSPQTAQSANQSSSPVQGSCTPNTNHATSGTSAQGSRVHAQAVNENNMHEAYEHLRFLCEHHPDVFRPTCQTLASVVKCLGALTPRVTGFMSPALVRAPVQPFNASEPQAQEAEAPAEPTPARKDNVAPSQTSAQAELPSFPQDWMAGLWN